MWSRQLFYTKLSLKIVGSDREEAEREEEEEVIAIQRRLALQIDEEDFGFDMLQEVMSTTFWKHVYRWLQITKNSERCKWL